MLPVYRTRLTVYNYEEIPAGYYHRVMESGSPVQRFWHREKFRSVIRRISDGQRMLDIGSGPGSLLGMVGEQLPGVVGIGVDVGSAQIEFAKAQIAPKFNGRISFQAVPGDSRPLPFSSSDFDVVSMIEVIEHLHPYVAMQYLGEARRLLKPQGKLLISTPNYRSLWPLLEWGLELFSPVKYHDQHISRFTPNSFVKFIESAGFEVVSVQTLFVIAPFLAPISPWLADRVAWLETKLLGKLGAILFVEARPMSL